VLGAALVALPLMIQSRPAAACADTPLLGSLCLFAGNFEPRGWAFADGRLLAISQNTALFSLLGTTYGGDGRTTFGLPDLRGRVPLSAGQAPGMSSYTLGEQGGAEGQALTIQQMPSHTHQATGAARGTLDVPSTTSPDNAVWAQPARDALYATGTPNINMAAGTVTVTVTPAGGSQPMSVMQPYLALNWIIALEGIYPSRN
jgi:microcystin-dependent protein